MSNLISCAGILIQPPTISTGVGVNANFGCILNGQCLDWEWSGPAIENGASRITITGSTLSISNLQKEDEGEYVCSCNNQHATATLSVRGKITTVKYTCKKRKY